MITALTQSGSRPEKQPENSNTARQRLIDGTVRRTHAFGTGLIKETSAVGLEEYKLRRNGAYRPDTALLLVFILQKEEAHLILSCPSKRLLHSSIIHSIQTSCQQSDSMTQPVPRIVRRLSLLAGVTACALCFALFVATSIPLRSVVA